MLAAIAVRLIEIRQPFIDQWSWRQSDVAAIARNYAANGLHFGRPQIDWAGDAAGYVGTEFPLLPFLAALAYKSAGVHEWIGRGQAVVCFAAALPFFYLLTRRLFGQTAALWATFFYALAPLSIVASRSFMPDIPSLSLAMAGLYFFVRWIDSSEPPHLLGSALLLAVALLVKLPTAVIGAPLLYLTWERFRWTSFRQPEIWIFGFIVLVPSAIWYWHAHEIAQRFYPYHFFGAGGFRIEGPGWYGAIAKQTALASLTPVLTVLALLGLSVVPNGSHRRLFHWWLAAMVLFIFAVGWGNRHQWYQLPLVPIAAVFAGGACGWISQRLSARAGLRWALAVLCVLSFVVASFAWTAPYFRPTAGELRALGLQLKETTPAASLLIAADDGDPTLFYYAERKGWHFPEKVGVFDGNPLDDGQLIADVDRLRSRGARYVVFYYGTRWWLDYYTGFAAHLAKIGVIALDTPRARIYELKPR